MNLAEELRALMGNDVVSDEAAELQAHGGDKWIANHPPDVVVFAESTEQVSRLLRFASEKKIPVTARGAGYGYVGSCVPVQGRDRALAHANEPDQGDQFRRCGRGGGAGSDHGRPPAEGEGTKAFLSAGPGQP